MEYIKMCVLFALIVATGFFISLIITSTINRKKKKGIVILLAVLTAFSLCCGCYFSLDLIFKDFVTETGVYVVSHRENFYQRIFFDTGKEKYQGYNVFSDAQIDASLLEQGVLYEYVYAKRTGVLLYVNENGTGDGSMS